MPEKETVTKKAFSADWFMRGALTRIGDTLDRLTGRNWQPSSSLATSGLVERLKTLLEAEKKDVPGKGTVVPHNIKLKMQWDKFSADESGALDKLRNELLTAAADHINDNLYYTYAPLHLEVKPDYFTEGVKLLVSFEQFADDEGSEAELNVTMPALKLPAEVAKTLTPAPSAGRVIARFSLNGKDIEKKVEFPADGRLTVGRTGSNGILVDDISVSKVHASIAISDGKLSVADTGSTNGTFINGERIAYGKAVTFGESDQVRFGTVDVTFEVIEPEEPTKEEASDGSDPVQIGDMEFRSRVTESTTPIAADTTPDISQLDTQKVEEEQKEDPPKETE
ncbi:MAG: FHA domain-containing protein [Pyrinomonadaceae bacterium]